MSGGALVATPRAAASPSLEQLWDGPLYRRVGPSPHLPATPPTLLLLKKSASDERCADSLTPTSVPCPCVRPRSVRALTHVQAVVLQAGHLDWVLQRDPARTQPLPTSLLFTPPTPNRLR